ncbi:LptF/LptG family permease [Opitutus sp. ER46]|uniref:LptF/LptG family permease n=1 Tax=Opitutus sp. ER46 TaxID=2161864 RepID=UPI000D308B85|nr:LptF/LptG family permease [Opitutus sp. ER46]PTX91787.1 YjgP/YjgQ family permease [Opitutus sp. ER46]
MNTFDRHLLREWLQILGLVLAATCGLLVIQVLYDDFQDLRGYGARGWVFWQYLGVTLPSFLAIVLPLALLVSLLYVLGKLHRANELTAMRAAGVSIFRITAPVWFVGILCCGISWWLNTTVVPWSVAQSRAMRETLEFRQQAKNALPEDRRGAVGSVAFDNSKDGRMWFFNRFSKYTGHGYGVAVSELDRQRREVRRYVAAEAWPIPEGGWVFINGRTLTYAPETGEMIGSKPFARFVAPTFREDPALMLLIDRKASDLSLHELKNLMAYLEAERSPKLVSYAVRYYSLIAGTLGPLIVIAIAIPFAVSGVRVNPAVGVSKSIGLFVVYYLLSNISASLATKGLVDASVAAWLPNIGMCALAAWLFTRIR